MLHEVTPQRPDDGLQDRFAHPLLPADVADGYRRNGYWEGITLASIVEDWAEREPARPAVTGPRTLTYGELWEGARRLAGTLLDSGMRPGEFLLAMMSNSWQGVVLEVAASVAGLVFTPRSLHMSPALAMTVFEQIDAGGVVVQSELLGSPEWRAVLAAMRERRPDRPIMVQGDRSTDVDSTGPTLEEAVSGGPIVDRVEHDAGRPCLVLSTGGTTGRPKSIVHCSDTLVYAARHFGADTEYSGDDVHVAFGPYGHAGGSVFEIYMPLLFGASILPLARWQPRAVAEAIHRWKGTYFITMGTHVYDLLGLEPDDDALLASMRLVTTGAGADDLFETAQRRFGFTFVRVYGCSEVPGHAIGGLHHPAEIRLRRDGVPFAGMDHRLVVPDSTQPSEKGAAGEYQCRGPNLFMGYLGEPELTAAAVTEDGFYRSGDLMTETDDGYVTWSGRLKDIIRRGGLQLDPVEMENLLSSHPRIAAVAVVGEPDPRLGERAVVVLVPADAGDAPDLADVCEYLVDHGLPKANLPERVVVVASLPRTEVGKVHRVEVKRWLTAEPAVAGDPGERRLR